MNRDCFRLVRILEMADRAEELTAGPLDEYRKSQDKSQALSYCCLIIGTASAKVSDDLKKKTPQIDWKKFASYHNLLEEYDKIDYDELWHTAKERFPVLKEQIKPILKELENSQ